MEHHADPHHPPAEVPFTDEEIKMLHSQDMSAATYVVGLMLFIFVTGIVLYSIVAFITAA